MSTIGYSLSVILLILPSLMPGVEAAAESSRARHRVRLSNRVAKSLAVSTLPEHVVAPDGQLSLFADYDDVGGDRVALYLVNRTDKRIGFFAQDNDVYVKLEALNEAGEWERAQVHRSSWCGNSYFRKPSLRPDEFFRFGGYHPQEGERRTVRYRLYSHEALVLDDDASEDHPFRHEGERVAIHLVSHSGEGMVSLQAIAQARRDSLAIKYGNFSTVRDIALGLTQKLPYSMHTLARSDAARSLRCFPTAEALALLESLANDPDGRVASAAVASIAVMGLEFEPAEALFQELLKGKDVYARFAAAWAVDGLVGHCSENPEIHGFINRLYQSRDPEIRSQFQTVLFPMFLDYSKRQRLFAGSIVPCWPSHKD